MGCFTLQKINMSNKNEEFLSTCLKFRNTGEADEFPCIISATMVFASDFELPGLPTRNSGIRSSIETTIMNTFSLRALFFAMFLSKLTFSRNTSWHLWKNQFLKIDYSQLKISLVLKVLIISTKINAYIKSFYLLFTENIKWISRADTLETKVIYLMFGWFILKDKVL